LVATRDDVVLTGRVADLSEDEAILLGATLNAHFATDGLAFDMPRANACFAHSRTTFDVAFTPLAAARDRPLLPHLPRGGDAPRWRRWQDEIQMLLHDHELNGLREAAGRVPISGIWFWGGGRLADCASTSIDVCAGVGGLEDLARGIALHSGSRVTGLPARYGSHASASHAPTLAVLPRIDVEVDLERVEQAWLAPALAALSAGRLDHLCVVVDGDGAAATFSVTQPSLPARIRAKFGRGQFTVPPLPES
jgi:hypothetical protein